MFGQVVDCGVHQQGRDIKLYRQDIMQTSTQMAECPSHVLDSRVLEGMRKTRMIRNDERGVEKEREESKGKQTIRKRHEWRKIKALTEKEEL